MNARTNSLNPGDDLDLGNGLRLAMVPMAELLLLEKNARFMDNRTYRNLVDNIAKDGRLESVPLCHKEAEGYRVLSGNHRVSAAIDAGLQHALILYFDGELSRAEAISKQLSHNAIAGQDDMAILSDLWSEIDDVGLKYYAGLDDRTLGLLEDTSLTGFTEERLDFQMLTFAFLPEEIGRLESAFKRLRETAPSDTHVARWGEYDRLLDAMAEMKARHTVLNSATAIMLMLEVVEAYFASNPAQEEQTDDGTTD